MTHPSFEKLTALLDILGLEEEPFGIFYTDDEPSEGFSPQPMQLPTREREIAKAAVLGGWDPSARKFFNTDELSFCVRFKPRHCKI